MSSSSDRINAIARHVSEHTMNPEPTGKTSLLLFFFFFSLSFFLLLSFFLFLSSFSTFLFLFTSPPPTAAKIPPKSPDDVVIVSAVRTAIGRGKKGSFKDTTPDDLLAAVLAGVIKKVNLDPKYVQDIQVGNVLPPGGGAVNARMAMFFAG